jgi:hypothetical protein
MVSRESVFLPFFVVGAIANAKISPKHLPIFTHNLNEPILISQ